MGRLYTTITAILVACSVTGCSYLEGTQKASNGIGRVAYSVEKAEPVIVALEDATGARLPDGVVESGAEAAEKVQSVAGTAGKVAAVVSAIPGPQQPYAQAISLGIGAIGSLAAAVAGFFHRRKTRALRSVMRAVDDESDIGRKIVMRAIQDGVADAVHAEYEKLDLDDER